MDQQSKAEQACTDCTDWHYTEKLKNRFSDNPTSVWSIFSRRSDKTTNTPTHLLQLRHLTTNCTSKPSWWRTSCTRKIISGPNLPSTQHLYISSIRVKWAGDTTVEQSHPWHNLFSLFNFSSLVGAIEHCKPKQPDSGSFFPQVITLMKSQISRVSVAM